MSEMVQLSVDEARDLIRAALVWSGASPRNAAYFTEAILDTEMSGLEGHGFHWLDYYCQHLQSGKVDGLVRPHLKTLSPTAFRVDARNGLAHPAIELGFSRLIPAATTSGIAALTIAHSYNAATLGYHTGVLARNGLIAFGFTNSIAAIAPVGGHRPLLGTNPMSFAVPGRSGQIRLLIDQSASQVAWTAVKRAAERGEAIPKGWALDAAGQPTDDPVAGLAGSMAPAGGYKGFNLALITEILCAALTGSSLGTEMGSFTANDGRPVDNGQMFIAISPRLFAGRAFQQIIDRLVESIVEQPGARLPNSRREANIKTAMKRGVAIESDLLTRLRHYGRAPTFVPLGAVPQ